MIFLVLIAVACAAPMEDMVLQGALQSPQAFANLFTSFEKEQGRQYSGAEKKLRANLFRRNIREVVSHNSHDTTWKSGVNFFADMTEEEKASYTGANMTMAMKSESAVPEWRLEGPVMPSAGSKDWRSTSVTKIKSQGHCGSCWVFSAVGGLEGAYKNRGSILKRFSEQEGLDCSMRNGCGGGWMQTVYDYAKKSGRLAEEDTVPYQGKERSCNYGSKKNGLIAFKITGYTNARGDSKHVAALSSSGPISVAYTCAKNFFQYKGGIYTNSRCSGGGHAVTSVGYASNYFLMKNSWGTSFGEKGYFRIGRGNVCGITANGYIPTLKATGKTDDGTDEGGDDGGDDGGKCNASDSNAKCGEWAARSPSECTENWQYMKANCAKSCGACACKDNSPKCGEWKGKGYCTSGYVSFMELNCRKTCDKCTDDGGDDGGKDGCENSNFKKCPDGECVHIHWDCNA